jgi:hypothetical protein
VINKISQGSVLYESVEDALNENPEDSVRKYSKLILQSCVDTCTQFSLSSLKSRHSEKLAKDWESIKQKVVDSRGMDHFSVQPPKRAKNMSDSLPVFTSAYNSVITNYFHSKTEDKYCNIVQELIQIEQNRHEIDRDNLVTKLSTHEKRPILSHSLQGLASSLRSFTWKRFWSQRMKKLWRKRF